MVIHHSINKYENHLNYTARFSRFTFDFFRYKSSYIATHIDRDRFYNHRFFIFYRREEIITPIF